jgi:cation:H+ antiporter
VIDIGNPDLIGSSLILLVAGVVIRYCGVWLTVRAEALARITGLGQALLGAVFLGAITSLAGTVTSVTAAIEGHAELAFGNAIGGIAAQTTFLVIADMLLRRANLEHAAASEANLMQGALLIVLLSIPLVAIGMPSLSILAVDVVSVLLVVAYVFGIRLVSRAHKWPMWNPRQTSDTQEPERTDSTREERDSLAKLWLQFFGLAVIVGVAGWFVARAGLGLVESAGLSETVVGNLVTSVTTSIPELVIAITAVRRGALTLAVGDILGGNSFDVLFLVVSDVAYREGSIYQAVSASQSSWLAVGILLTGILLMGFVRRERHGPGNIGFEGVLVLSVYAAVVTATVAAT